MYVMGINDLIVNDDKAYKTRVVKKEVLWFQKIHRMTLIVEKLFISIEKNINLSILRGN